MRAPYGIALALQLGAIVLLIVAQMGATPAPGLTGTPLAVTLLTAGLGLTLLTTLFLSLRDRRARHEAQREARRETPRKVQPGAQHEIQPDARHETPREVQPDARHETQLEARSGPQPEAQPQARMLSQPEVEREAQRAGSPLTQPSAPANSPHRSAPSGPTQPQPPIPGNGPTVPDSGQAVPHGGQAVSGGGLAVSGSGRAASGSASEESGGGRTVLGAARSVQVFGVPVALIALALAVVLSIALGTLTDGGAAIGALLVCVSLAVTRFPLRQALPIGLLAVGGLVVAGEIAGNPAQDLPLILSTCLIFLVSYAAKQRRATRAAEAREAVLAERARIAREIHDILAHSLSAQLVHLEGAKLLLRAERTAEALDRVTRARDLAKSGLDEARRAVQALREDPPPLPVALRTLAEDFESTTHQVCTLRVSGHEHRLSPETELALVRTAQEALTNVRRHAPGSPATVELEFDRLWCDLRITNPASAEKGSPGGGYGLVGMRERAELIGGTLSAGEHGGGFQVHLKVPA